MNVIPLLSGNVYFFIFFSPIVFYSALFLTDTLLIYDLSLSKKFAAGNIDNRIGS